MYNAGAAASRSTPVVLSDAESDQDMEVPEEESEVVRSADVLPGEPALMSEEAERQQPDKEPEGPPGQLSSDEESEHGNSVDHVPLRK